MWGHLIKAVLATVAEERQKWRGFTVAAIDKSTLALPETPELYRAYGAHGGSRGVGAINAEICCLFSVFCRIPLTLVCGRTSTSEHLLVALLLRQIKKGTLLLIDHGFYAFAFLSALLERQVQFVVPAATNSYFEVIRQLGPGDYLCRILDRKRRLTLIVRVVYVYRRGFRRKRLVTSLLDPVLYPAEELAALYHLRWDVETFYREFKQTMAGTHWHCRTPHTFQLELVAKMILVCLVRLPACQAAALAGIRPARVSFAATLAAVRRFMRAIVHRRHWVSFRQAWENLIRKVAGFVFAEKRGRTFPRDRQVYRRLSRDRRRRPPPRRHFIHGPETKSTTVRKYGSRSGYVVERLLS